MEGFAIEKDVTVSSPPREGPACAPGCVRHRCSRWSATARCQGPSINIRSAQPCEVRKSEGNSTIARAECLNNKLIYSLVDHRIWHRSDRAH